MKLAKAVVLTQPLSDFANHVSLLETARLRDRMRRRGINDPNSECTITQDQLIKYNLDLVTGKTGTHVVTEFYQMLHAPVTDDWLSSFGLARESCFETVVSGMCDAWRRLVLPYSGLPWSVFNVIEMDWEEGMRFLRELGLKTSTCAQCQDRFFTKATWLATPFYVRIQN